MGTGYCVIFNALPVGVQNFPKPNGDPLPDKVCFKSLALEIIPVVYAVGVSDWFGQRILSIAECNRVSSSALV
jgi:hypothetical protein